VLGGTKLCLGGVEKLSWKNLAADIVDRWGKNRTKKNLVHNSGVI